ncbi:MAG: type II secretion system protein [Geminicoccaceae bacterium]
MSARRSRTAGFTLLETLVALALLGIVMTTVFGIIGGGLRSARRDEDRLLLGLVAQNLLERSRLDLSPLGGSHSGDIGGGLRWQIDSEPYEPPKNILPLARPGRGSTDTTPLKGGNTPEDPSSSRSSFGQSAGLGSEGGSSGSGMSADDSLSSDSSSGGRSGLGRSGSSTGSGTESGLSTRERPAEKEKIKLHLVRITVTKDDQRFELTGLAMEPRRKRTAQPSLSESRRDATDQP